MLIPTSGSTSVSLWDAPDADALLAWLSDIPCEDVSHTVHPVQEEFALGMGDVTRARATERVSEKVSDVADATGRAVHDLDAKLKLSERAHSAVDAVRDSQVGRSTAAALTKAGASVRTATTRVLENEKVRSAGRSSAGVFF
ncbi:hypothetical protein H632_c1262p1 [Helicosporidium sp. ATCC 50920]|nr:hypothetical protein H632_c1262p1 [Helicosporidium sp. ATCC 50920]|eukprot:KDD74515.1 hypothetical protein H632_c1262p1 [Helicosporidium sp. ATCC 50920]